MRTCLRSPLVLAAIAMLAGAQIGPLYGQTKGMIVDHQTKKVTIFNANTDTVLGSVSLPVSSHPNMQFHATGDCSMTDDMKLGFVSNEFDFPPLDDAEQRSCVRATDFLAGVF